MNGAEESWVTQFNLLSLAGATMLWAAFLPLGVIARRYELVFQKWTGWKPLMLAPSGILLYVLIIPVGWLSFAEALRAPLEFIAYTALLISSLATLVMVVRFHRVIRQLTENETEAK